MNDYRWMIFDADNTLFDYDTAERKALQLVLEKYQVPFSKAVHRTYSAVNQRLWRKFEQGELTSQEIRVRRFQELAREAGFSYQPDLISADYLVLLGQQADLLPGARDLLQVLFEHPDYDLVLATNGIADVQRRRLAAAELEPFFQSVIISDEIGHSKPSPEYFQILFDSIQNPPRDQVLMIGDSLTSDIAGGVEFGIDTCWYNPRMSSLDGRPQPRYQIQKLGQILTLLDII